MTEPERNLREVFRVSAAEKAAIKVLADLRGMKPGTYARLAALGQLPAMGSRPPAMPERQGQAQAAPTIEEPEQEQRDAPRVGAEVAEAKLEDGPAREAFIARRTRELYGQGKTTRLAESQAAEEWERRGL